MSEYYEAITDPADLESLVTMLNLSGLGCLLSTLTGLVSHAYHDERSKAEAVGVLEDACRSLHSQACERHPEAAAELIRNAEERKKQKPPTVSQQLTLPENIHRIHELLSDGDSLHTVEWHLQNGESVIGNLEDWGDGWVELATPKRLDTYLILPMSAVKYVTYSENP